MIRVKQSNILLIQSLSDLMLASWALLIVRLKLCNSNSNNNWYHCIIN